MSEGRIGAPYKNRYDFFYDRLSISISSASPQNIDNSLKSSIFYNEKFDKYLKEIEEQKEFKRISKVVKAPKRDIEKVIDNWKDNNLGYILDSYDYHNATGEKISKLINRLNEENKPVFDVFLLSLTKDYNNKIINKYGIKALFDGINEIADHYGAETYLKMLSDPKIGFELPKGYMSEQNRKKVFEYVKNIKSKK